MPIAAIKQRARLIDTEIIKEFAHALQPYSHPKYHAHINQPTAS